MYRKDLLAIIKEAQAMVKYWSNYTYAHEDELAKMAAQSELRFWEKRVEEAREAIKNNGLRYFFREPMLLICWLIMSIVAIGIAAVVYGILWPVLNYAEWLEWLYWPIILISCVVPSIYTGYYLSAAINMLITYWHIAKCANVLSDISRCEKLLKG